MVESCQHNLAGTASLVLIDTTMELGVDKEKLLRTLRSDLTGLELRTGHGNISVFDKSEDGSDGSGSLLSSPGFKDDIVVYTHDVCKFLFYDRLFDSLADQRLVYVFRRT